MGDCPVHISQSKDGLDEFVQILPALEASDDNRIPLPGDIINGKNMGVFGDLLLSLDELPMRNSQANDRG
jgi:hypothetical protein